MRDDKKKYRDYVEGVDWLVSGLEVRVNDTADVGAGMRGVVTMPQHRIPAGMAVVQLIGMPMGRMEYEITELTIIEEENTSDDEDAAPAEDHAAEQGGDAEGSAEAP
jgi:hypothetical protein